MLIKDAYMPEQKYKNKQNADKNNEDFSSENIIYGRNPVKEYLLSGREADKLYILKDQREGALLAITALASKRHIPVSETDRRKLDLMTSGANHQGAVLLAAPIVYADIESMLENAKNKNEAPFIVILDGIEDPGNLGAIIRTAECSGAHGVVIPKRRAASLTPAALKATAGAFGYIPIARETNLVQTVKSLKEKGVWIYGAVAGGKMYKEVDFKGPCAIVLGSEGEGISKLLFEQCDFTVGIPLYGKINSLNVSAAAAVILTEAASQHKL